ncbi:MAG TPA: hypothetical protein VGC55_05625 [Dokdonella sp.]
MSKSTKTLAAAALALFCPIAFAAPKDELHAAFTKFLQAHSFRASVTDLRKGEQISSMEFAAPDRYRIQSAKGPSQLIVGDSMYMDMQGTLTRVPVPGVGKLVAQYRNEDFLRETESDMSVEALPDETVDGEATKVYHYVVSKPAKADAKTWISVKSGLPLQTESSGSFMGMHSTTRVRYSGYDDPAIVIAVPN